MVSVFSSPCPVPYFTENMDQLLSLLFIMKKVFSTDTQKTSKQREAIS